MHTQRAFDDSSDFVNVRHSFFFVEKRKAKRDITIKKSTRANTMKRKDTRKSITTRAATLVKKKRAKKVGNYGRVYAKNMKIEIKIQSVGKFQSLHKVVATLAICSTWSNILILCEGAIGYYSNNK